MSEDGNLKTNGFNKEQVQKLKQQWETAESEAASEIGIIMQRTKEAKAGILERADSLGIKKAVFRKVMRKSKLLRQAEEVRESIDDPDVVDHFDAVQIAVGLPLFDTADSAE